ncbi:MAG: CotH kinase family protein [Fibrobacter sp.]|nr:CotH kinase family protein [Fibrobacter sp.]
MNKKIILLSLCTASAFFTACSDDAPAAPTLNPSVVIPEDPGTVIDPVIDPITGEVVPPNPDHPQDPTDPGYMDPANPQDPGSTNPENPNQPQNPGNPQVPVSSSSIVQPGVSSSSTAPVGQSSSSGLKDYDDNHLPKESFLPAAGFYSNLIINPPTPQKGGQIKCTFDGSFPTQNSESITTAKQITQNTVIRCSEFVNGQPADTTTQTYFINENVSMPVVALTVNHHDMFDSTAGLYATGPGPYQGDAMNATDNNNPKCQEPCKGANFWKDTELPVHVEFFENGSSTKTKNWEIDAGISIIGNYSRYKPKKSVAIKMDNDNYGDKVLKYSLFKTRPEAKKIKSFNLRNNGNRFWTDYFGDAMLTSLMEGTEVDYQRSRQVVVFYNGEYFGIHDMRERLNRSFVETNYGIDSKSINVVKNCSSMDTGCQNGWVASGTNGASPNDFVQLVNQITNGNFEGENNQQYNQVKEKMNVVSFAQYMLAEMYIHNGDWPGNNIRAWGGNGNPFKFMIFDVDHGYGFTPGLISAETNMFQHVLGSVTMDNNQNNGGNNGGWGGMGGNNGGWGGGFGGGMWGFGGANSTIGNMLKKLLANPEFKRMFINQASILLNDYLTYSKVQAAVQNMKSTIPSSEQQRDEQRWPRNQSRFNWSPDGSDLLKFAQNRTETFKQEVSQYFGLSGEINVTITANGSGTIQVDGLNLPNSNYRGKFFSGNALQLTAIPAAGRVFAGWSDGSTENPHLVTPTEGMTISATFK